MVGKGVGGQMRMGDCHQSSPARLDLHRPACRSGEGRILPSGDCRRAASDSSGRDVAGGISEALGSIAIGDSPGGLGFRIRGSMKSSVASEA